MHNKAIRAFSPLLLLLLAAAAAQVHGTENTLELQPGAKSPPAKISDVAWIQGHWVGTGLGGTVEETWGPPRGGAMLGMYRLVKDGKPGFYELCALVEHAGSLLLRIKHFDPNLVGWEDKDKSTDFALVALRDGVAHFDGLTFKRDGQDALVIFVAIQHEDKELREEAFHYRRAKLDAPAGNAN